jgi:hypothetical protein
MPALKHCPTGIAGLDSMVGPGGWYKHNVQVVDDAREQHVDAARGVTGGRDGNAHRDGRAER